MPKRDFDFFIIDMLVALNTIQRKVEKMGSAEELFQNEDAWLSVTRSLEIVGEAMKNVLISNALSVEMIKQDWRDVVNLRNVVIHEYFGLNVEQVFDITKNDAPLLEKELIDLLKILPQKERFLVVIDQAVEDLRKARRVQSIDYLKFIRGKILS